MWTGFYCCLSWGLIWCPYRWTWRSFACRTWSLWGLQQNSEQASTTLLQTSRSLYFKMYKSDFSQPICLPNVWVYYPKACCRFISKQIFGGFIWSRERKRMFLSFKMFSSIYSRVITQQSSEGWYATLKPQAPAHASGKRMIYIYVVPHIQKQNYAQQQPPTM